MSNVILTTGIYDLIKDHVRRKRVTKEQEDILLNELKFAKQVLRRDLPENVVTVDSKVRVKELTSNEEHELLLVSTNAAKPKKNKHSILCEIGLATVGYKVGDIVNWPTEDKMKEFKILSVESIA